MATKYALSRDLSATNLTISKNSSNIICQSKNHDTKAYLTKSGGTSVAITKSPCSGYASAVLADNPDLYLQLTGGDFLTNSATVPGAVDGSSAPNVTSTTGKVGSAAAFNDTDARIQVPDYPEIRDIGIATNTITLEAWINWTSGGTPNDAICSKGPTDAFGGTGVGWAWYIRNSDSKLVFWSSSGTTPLRIVSTSVVPNGVETHVALSLTITTNSSGTFYFDGVADTGVVESEFAGIPNPPSDIVEDFNIGAYHPAGAYSGWHNGWAQHVAVWGSVALSQAQIQAHFNAS